MRLPAVPTAPVLIALAIACGSLACKSGARSPPHRGADGGGDAAAAGQTGDGQAHQHLLALLVDPWAWPRAAGAGDREKAIEDIGPYQRDPGGPADAPPVNSNARYWTELVGLAWDRDVRIDFDDEPVDLDGDGAPDMRLTRHVRAPGGVLANPELFGLVPTPEDPRGRIGRVSASTGVLGLREALAPDGRPTGRIGMTCFLCHGGRNPEDGRVALGLPGTTFDYGLLLATAAVLDDGSAEAAAYRRARGFPSGRTVRARLLLAGPGRQDLTGEFGLDVTVPGTHSARYPGTARVRQGTSGIVNPISVPGVMAAPGLDLQNWSGSEVASTRWLGRLIALGDAGPAAAASVLGALELPPIGGDPADLRAAAATRRALLLDLRNLGTLGLQQDSFAGLLWADAIYGHAALAPEALAALPRMYGAAAVRRTLAAEAAALVRPRVDPAAAARGRAIFSERLVGVIANRQILKEPPPRYAAARLAGPILAPLDEALPPRIPVRCADCHNATPGGPPVPLAANPPPFGRCGHCHRAHAPFEPAAGTQGAGGAAGGAAGAAITASAATERAPLDRLGVPAGAGAEVAFCARCHDRHRPFSPLAFSSSVLYPFDADADGAAQEDEADDARAGGIGTEPLLAFDVPRPARPPGGFNLQVPVLSRLHDIGPVTRTRLGVSWVRAAPLVAVHATAPYLHNGSVPTLDALLAPARRRPVSFRLGAGGFTFDTRLPGNRNIGHEFGTALTPREKDDLIAFLKTL
jgi:hypothetical protein